MEVIASDGQKIDHVHHFDGKDKIKLTKTDASDGKRHLIPVGWVDQHIRLKKASMDVKAQWNEAA
jgi:hypothetical protein